MPKTEPVPEHVAKLADSVPSVLPHGRQPIVTKDEKPSGGKKKNGGRVPGQRNATTQSIRKLAGKHGKAALDTLVLIMNDPEAGAPSRIIAANAVLDRAYGRSPASLDITKTHELGESVMDLLAEIGRSPRNSIKQVEHVTIEHDDDA